MQMFSLRQKASKSGTSMPWSPSLLCHASYRWRSHPIVSRPSVNVSPRPYLSAIAAKMS
jgi:hypothetical protein